MSLSRMANILDGLWAKHISAEKLVQKIQDRELLSKTVYNRKHKTMIENLQWLIRDNGRELFMLAGAEYLIWKTKVDDSQYGKDVFSIWKRFLDDFYKLYSGSSNLQVLTFLLNASNSFADIEAKTFEQIEIRDGPIAVICKLMQIINCQNEQLRKEEEYHKSVSSVLITQWLEDAIDDLQRMRVETGYSEECKCKFPIPITIGNLKKDPKILVWAIEDVIDFYGKKFEEEEEKQNTVMAPQPKRVRVAPQIEDNSPTPPLPVDDDDDDDDAAAAPIPAPPCSQPLITDSFIAKICKH